MKTIFWIILLPFLVFSYWATAQNPDLVQQITDLDELLSTVKAQRQQQALRNKAREQQFLADKKQQQALLLQAKKEFDQRQRDNQPLVSTTEHNRAEIEKLQQNLQDVVQDIGDLSSIFREFAGDFSAVLQESMITAQLPMRSEIFKQLATADTQVTIDDIETLWWLLQQEMTEAGKVARFNSQVVATDGSSRQLEVLRVGTFSAYAQGDFLRYIPQTGELLALARQPAGHYRRTVESFESAPGGLMPIPVDPSRGKLLGMLSYTPTLAERIEQGGIIALIIIALGLLGMLMAAWRGLYLTLVSLRISRQLGSVGSPLVSNPLGRVLLAAQGISLAEEDLLQLKLDEAVLAEIPALERGNGVIKLLAATSPLLGLLGTVTGMILTFQAISLFGTSDPKLMAGGISQALVTTVLGLVVAIPLLFSHSVIAYMSRSIIQRLDEQCAGVLARNAQQQRIPT